MVDNIVPFVMTSLFIILLLFLINFNFSIIVSIIVGCVVTYYIIDSTTIKETELFENTFKCSNIDRNSELNGFIYYAKKICKHNPQLFVTFTEKLNNFLELHDATTDENFSTNLVELDRLKRDIQNDFYLFIFSVPSDQLYITTINQGEIILSSILSDHLNLLIKKHMPAHNVAVTQGVTLSNNGPIPFSEYKDMFSPISFDFA